MKIRVAIGQIRSSYCNFESNVLKHIDCIDRAKQQSVQLLVFPELSLTGYYLQEAVADIAVSLEHLLMKKLAHATDGIEVVAGFVERTEDERFFNSAVFFKDRSIAGIDFGQIRRSRIGFPCFRDEAVRSAVDIDGTTVHNGSNNQ